MMAAAAPLSAEEAVRLAVDHSGAYATLQTKVEVEGALRERPRETEFRPVFRDLGSRTERMSTSLRLRQPLEPPGSLRAKRLEREAELAVERLDLTLLELDLRVAVLEAYDQARITAAEQTLAAEETRLATERVKVARLRLEGGLPVAKQVLDAEFERSACLHRGLRLELDHAAARSELAALIGTTDIELPADSLGDEAMRPVVSSGPPSVATHAQVERSEAALRARRAERRPFLDWVQGEVDLQPDERPSFGVAANVNLPLWRFLDGEVKAASAAVDVAKREAADRSAAQDSRLSLREQALSSALALLARAEDASRDAEAAVAELGPSLAPDELLAFQGELVGERRKVLRLQALALEARRAVENAHWMSAHAY